MCKPIVNAGLHTFWIYHVCTYNAALSLSQFEKSLFLLLASVQLSTFILGQILFNVLCTTQPVVVEEWTTFWLCCALVWFHGRTKNHVFNHCVLYKENILYLLFQNEFGKLRVQLDRLKNVSTGFYCFLVLESKCMNSCGIMLQSSWKLIAIKTLSNVLSPPYTNHFPETKISWHWIPLNTCNTHLGSAHISLQNKTGNWVALFCFL